MAQGTPARGRRAILLAQAAGLALAGAALAQPTPSAPTHHFDIPSENAALALKAFSRQSGRQIVFPYDAAAAATSPGATGLMSDRAALSRLLHGSNLEVAADDGRVVSVRVRPALPASAADPVGPAGSGSAGAAGDQPNAKTGANDAAGSPLAEVVVTATKRAETLENVPFAVSALGQSDLTARGAQTVEEAIAFVPGVNFTSNGANTGAYTIRGVNTSSAVANTQSPVALYIDDINILDPSYPKITTNLRLFDANRVEVLEGPQGTLFGSGSLGGAIRVITNKPNLTQYQAETEDTVSTTDGGGATYDVNAMANIPLVQDKLAVRLVGYYEREGGYVDNTTRGETDVNHANSQGARVELKWVPLHDLSFVASALLQNDRPHDSAFSLYDSRSYQWNGLIPNANYNNTKIYSLTGVYDLHWASLTSITTYADRKENIQADFSFSAQAILGVLSPSPINDEGPSHTFSQEVRLTSPDAGRFKWLVGGIYIDNRRQDYEPVVIPGSGVFVGADSDVVSLSDNRGRIQEGALFGELSYEVLPRLTATAGVRVFNDELLNTDTLSGTFQVPSKSVTDVTETSATPKFNLSYRLNSTSLVYFQAAEGYRIGQANAVVSDPISHQPIPAESNPDKLWNYELGQKGRFLHGRLVVNASLYYIDWSDIQLDELTAASGINFIANAGEAHVKGAELEVRANPLMGWDLGGSLSLNDTRLESVASGVAATKGDRLPGSAPQTVVLYSEYTYPLTADVSVFGRIDGRWIGKEYASLVNASSLTYGDVTTLNLRAGVNWSRFSLVGFADNAADSGGKTSAFPSLSQSVEIRQRPLTFGLTLDARL